MSNTIVYLCYRTDAWLSRDSRELVYIGEDKEDAIAQLIKYEGMTEKQSDQVREIGQSQSSGNDFEWLFEEVRLNCFC